MRRLITLALLAAVLGGCGGSAPTPIIVYVTPSPDVIATDFATDAPIDTPPSQTTPPTAAPTDAPTDAPTAGYTVSQQNAIRSAEDYLAYSSFSRSGLIGQLEYEGFVKADATFAVDHITVNWNEQAVQTAKDYLAYSAFSRSGLIGQLEYDGFTHAQAVYGVDKTGL